MKRKTNGFSCPLHPYQISSWVYTSYHIFTNIYMLLNHLDGVNFFLSIPLFVSQSMVIITGFLCTVADPTDQLSKMHVYDSTDDQLFEAMCGQCNVVVRPDSVHCSECNRCAWKFDHHCKWFNNCIARANYRVFICFIITLEINMSLSFALEFIIAQTVNRQLMVIIILDMALSSIIIILNTNLIGFHFYFYCKNITTYKYILSKRKNKHEEDVYDEVEHENEREEIGVVLDIDPTTGEARRNIHGLQAISSNKKQSSMNSHDAPSNVY